VQASAGYVTQFLADLAERSLAERVHVIAHSMGNRATLEAVHDIVDRARDRTGIRFSQFILAAPDVDADYFRQFAKAYALVAKRTTMYVSDRDQAVKLSRFVHGSVPRVGLAPPVQVIDGIDTVYVGKVDESLMGHSYVGGTWQLLNDIHQLIHLDADPAKRSWVSLAETGDHYELTGVV
jgi:esterase/lipase superfamily enzyme